MSHVTAGCCRETLLTHLVEPTFWRKDGNVAIIACSATHGIAVESETLRRKERLEETTRKRKQEQRVEWNGME